MTLCVRDEAEMLAANLAFHRAVGVERAYVYLDRCTDGSDAVARARPWVTAIAVEPADRVGAERFSDVQRTMMRRALDLARAEGFDWLLAIDADEFAHGDSRGADGAPPGEAARRGDLRDVVARLPGEFEAVRLPVREALPWPRDGGAWLGPGRPFLTGNDVVREILDPADGTTHPWRGPFGHRWGKSLVRTSADVVPAGAHRWLRRTLAPEREGTPVPDGPRLRTHMAGCLYHFALNGPAHWIAKYARFSECSDRRLRGKDVALPKRCWKRVANSLSRDEAAAYYARSVASPDDRVAAMLADGSARVDDTVARVLAEAGWDAPDATRAMKDRAPPLRVV